MKRYALIAGPLAAAIVATLLWTYGHPPATCWIAAVITLCATWWVTEPIPIAATALAPFAIFPLAGIITHKQAAAAYGHPLIMLFLGGFILSAAMEKSGAHKRIAVAMVHAVGATSGKRLVLGFMLASAALSMWISNTATVLMLLPIIAAVLQKIDDKHTATALTLGVAYAGSIGGLGTPIGSPPNMIFMGIYEQTTGHDLGFVGWMSVALPVVAVFLPLAWLWLTRSVKHATPIQLDPPDPWSSQEILTLAVFLCTATAWVTRTAPYGGWSALLGIDTAGDSTVALAAAFALFIIPDQRGGHLMDWNTAKKIPWDLLILFGGGLAIAKAFDQSGLNADIGNALSGLTAWPIAWTILALCIGVTFLTEVTSNTATATMLMPILAAASLGADTDPRLLMIPATLSASCAFMLPVATPPNAIVFSTHRVTIRQMTREGFALNLLGAVIITATCLYRLNAN